MPNPQKLVELLTFHSFEIESIKEIRQDFVLDINVLPNRAPDCFSHLGIAREIAAIIKNKFQVPSFKFQEGKKLQSKDFVEVKVENSNDCPRYTAKVVLEVRVKPSPKWMQERLKVCGLQPINNIVDIANFVMLETGQPIHAFDFDKIKSVEIQNPKSKSASWRTKIKTIIVRRAKKGERIKALDDKEYKLDESILVIADVKRPIAIAGIKGGEATGIDKNTKNIVIEAANFNQVLIRKGSQKLKLKTDASLRFEHGINLNLVDFAQQRICYLIKKFAGGKIVKDLADFSPDKVYQKKIKLNLNSIERLLGVKIPAKVVKRILQDLGFESQVSGSVFQVKVPTRRLDVSIEEDLIEEIGRIFGYKNIPSEFPQASLIPPERNEELFWEEKIKNSLKELGFCEVYNYSFLSKREKEIFGFKDNKMIEIANPMSSENRYLTPSLVPKLIKNVKDNLRFFNEVKIFELGEIFKKGKTPKYKVPLCEKKILAGVLVKKGGGDELFYELKGASEDLLNQLGISNVWYDDFKATPEDSLVSMWHPGKCAEIKVGGEEIGFLGEIHPRIIENFGLKEKVFIFDFDFEKLENLALEEAEYQPVSLHPTSIRDLAVLVPQGTRVVEVLNIIEGVGGNLVRDVDLFDVYSGQELPEGMENLAFHIIYQAEDRTLKSEEVQKIHQKIIKSLEENPSWEVRK